MLPNRLGVVILYVSDMERSVAFYRDGLGLPLRFESPYWTEFETDAVTLALHWTEPQTTAPAVEGAPGSISLSWYVEDVNAVFAALRARGVEFVQEPATRPEEGIRLAKFTDPDGAVLSLCQRVPPAAG